MPSFVTNGTTVGTYNCGQGVSQTSYTGVTPAECATYIEALKDDGFVSTAPQNTIGGNTFYSYAKGTKGLHLAYYPNLDGGTFKIVTDVYGYEPARTPETAGTVSPTLVQFQREGVNYVPAEYNTAPGMGYILQLSDGRFILVDGGPGHYKGEEDCETLWNQLSSMAGGSKPVIAGWFFTHAHGDHMGLANKFMSTYAGQIELQAVYANFPAFHEGFETGSADPTIYLTTSYDAFCNNMSLYYQNVPIYKFQTGEKFYIGDAEIDILYTHQDFQDSYECSVDVKNMQFRAGNDTSAAFRITLGGMSMMFLGDCEAVACQAMTEMYGDALKCDIMQVPHHGGSLGSNIDDIIIGFYKKVDPDICVWPNDSSRFDSTASCLSYTYSAWLRNKHGTSGSNGQRDRAHYHASVTTVIDLTNGQVTQP